MKFSRSLLLCVLSAGCTTDPPQQGSTTTEAAASTGEASTGEGSSEGGTSSSSSADSSSGSAELEPILLDRAWVESLAGPWRGPVRATPIGGLPDFFWEFAWTEDETMVAVADNGMGFRFEFVFAEADGQWTLTETGTLPGGMTQSYVLHPVAQDGARVRFEVLERPGYLQLDIEPTGTDFDMAVSLRGEPHGTFDLARPD